jgi:hypothetical protein
VTYVYHEKCVDMFHSQHPTKTVNLSEGKDGIQSEP